MNTATIKIGDIEEVYISKRDHEYVVSGLKLQLERVTGFLCFECTKKFGNLICSEDCTAFGIRNALKSKDYTIDWNKI